MLDRRSLLSGFLLPAALGGLVVAGEASGRSSRREFVGVDSWFNTDRPLTMAKLRGNPVLVEFGTYTRINWRRTLPHVKRWRSEYAHRDCRSSAYTPRSFRSSARGPT